MKHAMQKLFQGQDLNAEEAVILFESVLLGEQSDIEISAILTALKVKGETGTEISSLVKVLRQHAQPIDKPSGVYADCCGTGGDGLGTFNVSTAAALTVPACGLTMVKHGNRSSSSPSGSADIIEQSGVPLDLTPTQCSELLNKENFCFLFAPAYHPLVGHVMPVRKTLATATIFNLAGPLANPTAPEIQLMGVCEQRLLKPMAEVLQQIGCRRALVVYGSGLDEVALHGPTEAILVDGDNIEAMQISPADFGVTTQPLDRIQLHKDDNPLQVFQEVIAGTASSAKLDMVAINAGSLLWLAELADNLKDGYAMALDALTSGKVASKLAAIQRHLGTGS